MILKNLVHVNVTDKQNFFNFLEIKIDSELDRYEIKKKKKKKDVVYVIV